MVMETGTGGNFRLSPASATGYSYGASCNIATETTFTICGAHDRSNVQSGRFNLQFCLRHVSANRGRHPQ